jgi:hypothetical protein
MPGLPRLLACLVLLACLSGCQLRCGGPQAPAAVGFNPIAPRGPETWLVDGAPHRVDASYFLDLPEGLQFTVEVPLAAVPSDEAEATELAWPFIRHAYEQKLFQRTQIRRSGQGPLEATRIGVALVQHAGSVARGKRLAMSLREIEARLGARSADP